MATLSGGIGTGSKWLLDKIVGVIAATGINPNLLTFLGLVVNFGGRRFLRRGPILRRRADYFLRRLPGHLGRPSGSSPESRHGLWRLLTIPPSTAIADMALYMGLLVYYSVSGRTPYVVLAAVATAAPSMVSYARARAESLIPLCKVGFMERTRAPCPAQSSWLGQSHGAGAHGSSPLFPPSPFPTASIHLARNPRRPRPPRIKALALGSRRVPIPSARKTQQKVRLDFSLSLCTLIS